MNIHAHKFMFPRWILYAFTLLCRYECKYEKIDENDCIYIIKRYVKLIYFMCINNVFYRYENLQGSLCNQLNDNLGMCVSFIRLYIYMHALIIHRRKLLTILSRITTSLLSILQGLSYSELAEFVKRKYLMVCICDYC